MRMETPCTDSNDAVCVCDYNYFLDSVSGGCEPCTVCPAGQGVYSHCEYDRDTVCEECVDNTYSDRQSSLDPCLPCTICDEDTETQLEECSPVSDSVCHSEFRPIPPRWRSPEAVTTATLSGESDRAEAFPPQVFGGYFLALVQLPGTQP